jgi:hypothetical protein
VLQGDVALDPKAACVSGEVRDCDAIVEDVVNPAQAVGPWLDLERRIEKPLIVAVARAEHHPMLSEADGFGVGVGGNVFYSQNCHALSIEFRAVGPSSAPDRAGSAPGGRPASLTPPEAM